MSTTRRSRASGRTTLGLAGAWIGLLAAFGYVVFIGGTYPWMGSQVVRVVTHLTIAALVVPWLVFAILRPEWRPTRATVVPVALCLVAAATSTALSPAARIALEGLLYGVATALLFLLLTRLSTHPWFRPRLKNVLVALPVVVVGAYLIQVVLAWIEWWGLVGFPTAPPLRPAGVALTFGAAPIVAGLLLLLVPAAALLLNASGSRRAAVALVVASTLAVVITASRAAYLGLLVAVAAAGILAGGSLLRRDELGARLRSIPPRMILAVAVPIVIVGIVFSGPLLARILESLTIRERLDIWRSAAALFGDSPLVGTGPGTWPVLKYATNPVGAPNLVVPHAHSIPAQSAAELGAVGLVVLGITVGWFGRRINRARIGADPALRAAATGALVGLAGMAALSLVEDFTNLLAVVLPTLLLVAWVLGGAEGWSLEQTAPARRGPNRGYAFAAAAALAALLAFSPVFARGDEAALTAEAGLRAANSRDWPAAVIAFRRAFDLDPDMPLYQVELATALANTADEAAARGLLRRAVEVEGSSVNLLSLAWLDLTANDITSALSNARLARERGASDPLVALNVGAIAEQVGDLDLTRDSFAGLLVVAPHLAPADYWRDRRVPRDAIIESADLILAASSEGQDEARVTRALLRAYAGEPARAEAELAVMPSSPSRERALAACAWLEGDRARAIATLRAHLAAYPQEGASAADLAGYLLEAGDVGAAQRAMRQAEFTGFASSALAGARGARIVTAAEAGTSGQPLNYPWMIYLRFGPRVMTPPQFLVIVPD
jgi:O-antigen ligase/Tfp pilus assembly protein PilF